MERGRTQLVKVKREGTVLPPTGVLSSPVTLAVTRQSWPGTQHTGLYFTWQA